MKLKEYVDVFAWADTHPQAKPFYEESIARVRLAEAIYQERTAPSLSVKELAQKSQVSVKTIRAVENSESSVKLETVFKLHKALGRNKIELFVY